MSEIVKLEKMKVYLQIAIYTLVLSGYPIAAILSILLGVENRFITVPFRLLILLISVILVSVHNKRNGSTNLIFFIGFILFWSIYFLKLFIGEIFENSVEIGLVEFSLYAFGTCFLPSLAFFLYIPFDSVGKIKKFSFAFLSIGCCVSIYYGLVNFKNLIDQDLVVQRLSTDTIDPISMSNIGVSLIILSFTSIFERNVKGSIKIVYVVSVAMGIFSIAASGSRGPVISLLIVMGLFFLYNVQKNLIGKFALLIVFTIIAIGFTSYLETKFNLQSLSRLQSGFDYTSDQSILERFELISTAVDEFLDNPLVGGRIGGQGKGRYPHNVFVESFMATGFFGGISFSLMFLSALLSAINILKYKKEYSWIALIFLQYAIEAQVSGSLYTSPIMWCFMSSVIGICYYETNRGINENCICS